MKFASYQEFYKFIAPYYDKYINKRVSQDEVEQIKQIVFDHCKIDCNILDVGCGDGRIAVPIQNSGLNVTGIDICHEMISQAKLKGLRNAQVSDITNFKSCNLYDMLISIRMGFSYTNDLKTMSNILTSCYNLLKDDGVILWDTPHIGYFGDKVRIEVDMHEIPAIHENVEFECYAHTKNTITSVFTHCGFYIEHIWGDFTKSEFNSKCPRVFIYAKKKVNR